MIDFLRISISGGSEASALIFSFQNQTSGILSVLLMSSEVESQLAEVCQNQARITA